MSFGLYLVGVLVVLAGVAWALTLAGVATKYIVIAGLVIVGLGIITGVSRTRTKDV
ncbi:MAG: hypothetical protein V4558_13015 [Gemmatimonadota bacterium]